jgi:hypothetical protein
MIVFSILNTKKLDIKNENSIFPHGLLISERIQLWK